MSDDSHGIDQVGTNYPSLLDFIKKAGITEIHYADPDALSNDSRFPNAGFSSIAIQDLIELPYWIEPH